MKENTAEPHMDDTTTNVMDDNITANAFPEDAHGAENATDPHIEDPQEGANGRDAALDERVLAIQSTTDPFPEDETDPHIEDPEAMDSRTDSVSEERTLDTSFSEMIWAQLMPRGLWTAAGDTTMDETIWAQTPDEVLVRVFAFLPLRMLFQLRAVCRRWAGMIRGSDFNRMCVDVKAPALAAHPAVCCVYNRLGFRWATYDNEERRWQRMPDRCSRSQEDRTPKREIYVASRGLLCLLEVGDVDLIKSLTVWNPLTNHEAAVPRFLSAWSFPLVRVMFHGARTRSYKLILAGNQNYHPEDARYSATEVFDSARGLWGAGGKLPPSLRFPFSNGAVCNGAVYCFASRPMTMYDILLAYDVAANQWSEIKHIVPSNTYCTPYLFECDGNLLTVMHLLSGPPVRIASCGIFRLDFGTKEWRMVIQMPGSVYREFSYIGGCVAAGKQLCVTGNAPNRDMIVAVYCQQNEAWFWLPPCPIATSCADLIERHTTFTFYPTLID